MQGQALAKRSALRRFCCGGLKGMPSAPITEGTFIHAVLHQHLYLSSPTKRCRCFTNPKISEHQGKVTEKRQAPEYCAPPNSHQIAGIGPRLRCGTAPLASKSAPALNNSFKGHFYRKLNKEADNFVRKCLLAILTLLEYNGYLAEARDVFTKYVL